MSAPNRIYTTKRKALPEAWRRQQSAGVAEAQARRAEIKRPSWWTAHASPDARETFIAAARQRTLEREHQTNAAQWRALVGARKSAGMQS